jgi:hypothetical protein
MRVGVGFRLDEDLLTWSSGEQTFETQHERPAIQPADLQMHVTSICEQPVELRLLPTQLDWSLGQRGSRDSVRALSEYTHGA